ncbi:DUF5634 family protein [Paraliobacillus sp. X-1268]|uniref:DUF5634 family protein n=1 Tax=Paraliobacillus sp. X-1268 TaxID=2213193 RepID=UPI000E3B6208|nr:DUF5634 family protein [Paraliobacillus sp. X-1268]
MKICMRNQLIENLELSIPQLSNKYHFDSMTTYLAKGQADSLYIGYKITVNTRNYYVYLPFMSYSEEALIPLTPIWTLQSENYKGPSFRGFDHLDNCLDALDQSGKDNSINQAI